MRGLAALIAVSGLLLSFKQDCEAAEPLSVICKGEQSIGFNWINNGWQNVRFPSHTYLISKTEPDKTRLGCLVNEMTPPIVSKNQKILSDQCYEIKLLGGNAFIPDFMCTEFRKIVEGVESVTSLYCTAQNPSIRLAVDGEFVLTDDIAPFVHEITGKRYSITMEIGKCARVPR